MPKIIDGNKQILTSGYGTGLNTKQKTAVNIIQTPFINIGQTWGAGAIGTGEAPIAFRQTDAINGLIITEVQIDLTGLKAKGGDAGDVIGLGIKMKLLIMELYLNTKYFVLKYQQVQVEQLQLILM